MKLSLRSGFTLVELMIVIAIIGILAVALFPSLSSYLARGREVGYQMIARNWIGLIEQYRVDHDGSVNSEQLSPTSEVYCISASVDANCDVTRRHTGLSNFFLSSADGKKALQDKTKMYLYTPNGLDGILWLYRQTAVTIAGAGGTYPMGIDPTRADKIERLLWRIPDIGGDAFANATGTSRTMSNGRTVIFSSGVSLGTTADKHCSPGIALNADSSGAITCMYVFH